MPQQVNSEPSVTQRSRPSAFRTRFPLKRERNASIVTTLPGPLLTFGWSKSFLGKDFACARQCPLLRLRSPYCRGRRLAQSLGQVPALRVGFRFFPNRTTTQRKRCAIYRGRQPNSKAIRRHSSKRLRLDSHSSFEGTLGELWRKAP